MRLIQLGILLKEKELFAKQLSDNSDVKNSKGQQNNNFKKLQAQAAKLRLLRSDIIAKDQLRDALSELLKKCSNQTHAICLLGDALPIAEKDSVVYKSSSCPQKIKISTKLNKKEYFYDSVFDYTPEQPSYFEIYNLILKDVLSDLEKLDLTTEPIGHTILSLGQSSQLPALTPNQAPLKSALKNPKDLKENQEGNIQDSTKNQLITKLLVPHDFRTKSPKSGLFPMVLFFMYENLKRKYQVAKNQSKKFYLRVSALEFHREKITDLLKGNSEKVTPINIDEKENGLSLEGCVKKPIKTEIEILDTIEHVNKRLMHIRRQRVQPPTKPEVNNKQVLTSFQKNRLMRAGTKLADQEGKPEENLGEFAKVQTPDSLIQGHVLIRIEILCPIDEKKNKKVASVDFMELGDFNFGEISLSYFLKYKETQKGQKSDDTSEDRSRDLRAARESSAIADAVEKGNKMYTQDKCIIDLIQSSIDLSGKIYPVVCLSKDIQNLDQTKYLARVTSKRHNSH